MLEDLKLVNCSNVRGGRDVYEAAGTACARLKDFTLRKGSARNPSDARAAKPHPFQHRCRKR
jgi:hypothetical protein